MALDACEPAIIRALEKDGWTIHEKPFMLRAGGHTVFADFTARRELGNRIEEIIVFEVKCFTNPDDDLQELYTAIGQYVVYRAAISLKSDDLPLFLAMPTDAYERLTRDRIVSAALKLPDLNIVTVDMVMEVVTAWIS